MDFVQYNGIECGNNVNTTEKCTLLQLLYLYNIIDVNKASA